MLWFHNTLEVFSLPFNSQQLHNNVTSVTEICFQRKFAIHDMKYGDFFLLSFTFFPLQTNCFLCSGVNEFKRICRNKNHKICFWSRRIISQDHNNCASVQKATDPNRWLWYVSLCWWTPMLWQLCSDTSRVWWLHTFFLSSFSLSLSPCLSASLSLR